MSTLFFPAHSSQNVTMSGSNLNLRLSSKIDDPPPPYNPTDQTALNADKEETPSGIPHGRWDLACGIHLQSGLQLNAKGEPVWMHAAMSGDQAYQRDGFSISLEPQIVVTNAAYNWTCDETTVVGQLLMSKRDNVSLRNFGKHLIVFERTVVEKDRDRPPPKPHDDRKGYLKVESQSSRFNVWSIAGTDIYQVEGDENDIVVKSPKYLRLWDMAQRKFRWEKKESQGHILGLSKDYVIREGGRCYCHERKTGEIYGDFQYPLYSGCIDFNKDNHFGPVVSTQGLFLYKPCRKVLYIFQVNRRQVYFRVWESAKDIKGSLLLRGSLENLELELIQQEHTWSKSETTEGIRWYDPIKKKIIM